MGRRQKAVEEEEEEDLDQVVAAARRGQSRQKPKNCVCVCALVYVYCKHPLDLYMCVCVCGTYIASIVATSFFLSAAADAFHVIIKRIKNQAISFPNLPTFYHSFCRFSICGLRFIIRWLLRDEYYTAVWYRADGDLCRWMETEKHIIISGFSLSFFKKFVGMHRIELLTMHSASFLPYV